MFGPPTIRDNGHAYQLLLIPRAGMATPSKTSTPFVNVIGMFIQPPRRLQILHVINDTPTSKLR